MYSKISATVCFCVAFIAITSPKVEAAPGPPMRTMSDGRTCKADYSFEFFNLVLHWEIGNCVSGKQNCELKPRPRFSIHGLWPDNYNSYIEARYCCASSYDEYLLRPLINEMKEYWPSLNRNKYFHAHQWKKHGSCAIKTPGFENQTAYFRTTLRLFKSLNIESKLHANGIFESNTKPISKYQLLDALSDINSGARPYISCERTENYKYPLLTDLKLCFSKKLEPIDCPVNSRCDTELLLLDEKKPTFVPGPAPPSFHSMMGIEPAWGGRARSSANSSRQRTNQNPQTPKPETLSSNTPQKVAQTSTHPTPQAHAQHTNNAWHTTSHAVLKSDHTPTSPSTQANANVPHTNNAWNLPRSDAHRDAHTAAQLPSQANVNVAQSNNAWARATNSAHKVAQTSSNLTPQAHAQHTNNAWHPTSHTANQAAYTDSHLHSQAKTNVPQTIKAGGAWASKMNLADKIKHHGLVSALA